MKKINVKNREEYSYYLMLYLKNKDKVGFREEFLELHPTDQIDMFTQMSEDKRKRVYDYISPHEFSEIFKGLELPEQKKVFTELDDEYAVEILSELPVDDSTDFLGDIPTHISTYFLNKMDKQDSDTIKLLLSYKDDTAGSLMTTEFMSISPDDTVGTVMERLRKDGAEAETIYYLYVVNEEGTLLGVVSLRELITSVVDAKIEDIMKEQLVTVSGLADQEEVSTVIKDYDLLAVPVVTPDGRLIGIVTVDDILDVMEEEATEDIGEISAVKGALDIDVDAITATKRRVPWLILLLFLGMATAGLISSFEATLAEMALIAIFIPLIADMAGNTGTQSLAIVVRGLALQKFDKAGILKLCKREFATGLMMGLICGGLVTIIVSIFPFGNMVIGFIIGVSLFATVVVSTMTGTIIPLIVDKLKIDPAVASGPFITTINDIIGLFIYFSIATSLLHLF